MAILYQPSWRVWMLALLLVVSTALGLFLYEQSRYALSQKNQQQPQNVEFIIHRFEGLAYDHDGTLQYSVDAETLTQYISAMTKLDNPVITTGDAKQPIWIVRAKQGFINKALQKITLEKQVVLSRAQQSNPPQLTTEVLDIFPEKDWFNTDHQVQITHASGKIRAVGMHGKIRSQELTLESQVSGYYDPVQISSTQNMSSSP